MIVILDSSNLIMFVNKIQMELLLFYYFAKQQHAFFITQFLNKCEKKKGI